MKLSSQELLTDKFGFLGKDFLQEFFQICPQIFSKAKSEIVMEDEKIKHIFFLISGSLKVYSLNDGRELIYYYIRPSESCLMTFSSIFKNYISKVNVVAEVDSELLLIPVSTVHDWLIRFPEISRIFFSEYDNRFSHLMNVINDAVFHKLDKRIFNYISQQIFLTNQNPIKLTHREIAANLGTSREVVSRILKKMETEGAISQSKAGIGIKELETADLLQEM